MNHLCRLLVASNRLARLSGRQCIPPHDTQDHWHINLLIIMIMLTITSATVTWVTTRAVALKTIMMMTRRGKMASLVMRRRRMATTTVTTMG